MVASSGGRSGRSGSGCVTGPEPTGSDRQVTYDQHVSGEPDFTEMYGDNPLTPRMAARLWVVAQLAHDAFRQGMAEMWLE